MAVSHDDHVAFLQEFKDARMAQANADKEGDEEADYNQEGVQDKAQPERRLFSSRDKNAATKTAFEVSVEHWSREHWQDLGNNAKREEGLMVMFYAPWCEMSKLSQPIFATYSERETANKYPSPVAVNCEVEKELCKDEAINGYPTFMFYKNKVGVEFEGAVTVSRLSKFTRKHVGGSEPDRGSDGSDTNLHLPAFGTKEESGEVVKITNDDFGKRRDPKSSLFIMFYTPWCDHCMDAKPAFILASKGGSAGKELNLKGTVFGAVDCDAEEELCQDFSIKKYPTFAYMPGNVKDVVPDEYTGERDAEEMVDIQQIYRTSVPDSFEEV